jgi:hypothetical protein
MQTLDEVAADLERQTAAADALITQAAAAARGLTSG